jgi:glycosyltransferase involved in cell wall biosynthesis
MKRKRKVSVVIPVYNAEKLILETLKALDCQTFKDFEAIIVNDGSTDNSLRIINNYKPRFFMRVASQKNFGPARARNKGAKMANGEIIIFIDSDCVPYPDFIERMIAPFKNKSVVGVQGDYETKNKESVIARYVGYEIGYRHENMGQMKKIDHIATYAAAYRKKDFGRGFSEEFKKADMEDTEFSYRLAKAGKILVFEPSAVVKHPHPSTLSKFLGQQYRRGYWRSFGHRIHPEKLVKDSYMGRSIALQGSISAIFFIATFFSILFAICNLSVIPFIFPIVVLLILFFSNVLFGIFCYRRYEKKMLIVAPAVASFRSLAGTLGFLRGLIEIELRKVKVLK